MPATTLKDQKGPIKLGPLPPLSPPPPPHAPPKNDVEIIIKAKSLSWIILNKSRIQIDIFHTASTLQERELELELEKFILQEL